MVGYSYWGQSRKYQWKEEAVCSTNKVMSFYRQLKKSVFADPKDIDVCQVCDGCSYQLQITFTDGRRKIVNGDLGGGTIDRLVLKFLPKSIVDDSLLAE